ncbi:glycosyl transferase [Clostridium perfringens]|uniref:glycosyltransferase family 2 protein n=1 Tax=Clostridium perfringens TaxID=1502 RepID=UPI0010397BFF|nr:glycosyltransferase [Clostridium perfringens]MDM0469396.1 glycosyltransferase [Clostridium perfringens]MDM0626631.1 glycosyltransferase [Clostridium perfringens]MDU5492891.1 glycosyltransferase [Clostridium perfringens]TBX15209.1 glycosyl transferase [Clostridium perfringens]
MKEKISIITASYNAERFIKNTIESVLKQTYQNWEMIIIDDCSSDNTESIVNRYVELDKRIKFYKLEKNSGAAIARNLGINKANGEFIAFLDSDDLWDENKLEKQIEFMKERKIGFSFTGYRLMKENGELLNKEIMVPEKVDYNSLLKNTIIGCLTVMIDKRIIGEFKMPELRAGQDTATWLSILRKGNIAYGYNEILASYRLVNGSISSNKMKALKRTWNIYRNVENLSLYKSIYCFLFYSKNAFLKRFR